MQKAFIVIFTVLVFMGCSVVDQKTEERKTAWIIEYNKYLEREYMASMAHPDTKSPGGETIPGKCYKVVNGNLDLSHDCEPEKVTIVTCKREKESHIATPQPKQQNEGCQGKQDSY